MFPPSFSILRLSRSSRRRARRPRNILALAAVAALLAIPAIASAAGGGSTTRADLSNVGGYCQSYQPAGAGAIGKVQIAAPAATSPGFHQVEVDIKIRGGKIPAGTYQVYLVNLYRDATGQIMGCAASPFPNALTVKGGGPANFRGSVDRYTGQYELQLYIGPIWGPGYGTSPQIVDVP
jgi:hypothetical protein